MNIGLIIQKNIKRIIGVKLIDQFLKPKKPVAVSQPATPPPAPIPPVTTQAKPSPPPSPPTPTPTTPPAAQGELPPPQGEPTPKPVFSLFARLARGPVSKSVGTEFKKITGWGTTKLRLKTKRTTAKLFDRLFLKPKPTPLEPSPAPPAMPLPRKLEAPVSPPSTKVEPKKPFIQTIRKIFSKMPLKELKPKALPKAELPTPETPSLEPVSLPPLMIPPEQIQEPFPSQPPPQNPIVSFFSSLGKTAVRKAVKTGIKKIASWGASKLSLAAIPEPLVSKVLLVASLIKDGISLIKRGIKKLIGGIAGQIGGFLSGAAGTVGGLFSGLTTVSLPATLPAAGVGGTLAVVVLITIIVVMTVGGAFQRGKGGGISNLGSPVVARPPAQTDHLAEEVIWTLNQCGITAVNKNTWAKTETCLRSSPLPNKEIIIAQFHFSVYQVGPGLQCVGFVRGVMAAIGKDPGGNRDAKDYLNPPPPAGYQPLNTNMNEVKIGDLVIMRGSGDGHMGIVVEKTASSIWVAQAWGTNGGAIQITEVNPVYFDGFLRLL